MPKQRGPKSPFGPKALPNKSHSLTRFAKDVLAATARRTGENESNIIELLARCYGGPQIDALVAAVRADAADAGGQ